MLFTGPPTRRQGQIGLLSSEPPCSLPLVSHQCKTPSAYIQLHNLKTLQGQLFTSPHSVCVKHVDTHMYQQLHTTAQFKYCWDTWFIQTRRKHSSSAVSNIFLSSLLDFIFFPSFLSKQEDKQHSSCPSHGDIKSFDCLCMC